MFAYRLLPHSQINVWQTQVPEKSPHAVDQEKDNTDQKVLNRLYKASIHRSIDGFVSY